MRADSFDGGRYRNDQLWCVATNGVDMVNGYLPSSDGASLVKSEDIGAGNLFVAPVEVGDNVTSGAGSVIRHAVPDDAMVYSENTQHVVEGWKPAWER